MPRPQSDTTSSAAPGMASRLRRYVLRRYVVLILPLGLSQWPSPLS
jgi:hypothetical protein